MRYPTDRIVHTMVSVTPVVEHGLEREIVQWVYQERLIPCMRVDLDRGDDLGDDFLFRTPCFRTPYGRLLFGRQLISRSSQCSTTGVTKAVVCVILSVG